MKNYLFLLICFSTLLITGCQKSGDIVYYLSDETGSYNLWRGDYHDGNLSNIKQLTFYENSYISDFDICESTGQIAFLLIPEDDHRGDVFIASMDLESPRKIPNQPSERISAGPKFSPDGSSILYSLGANRSSYNSLVVAIQGVDGSRYRQIISATEPRGYNTHKTSLLWMDNGLYIGDTKQFSSAATKYDIFFYDFHRFMNLTNTNSIGEKDACISPNGRTIAYRLLKTSSPAKNGIGMMDIDGRNKTNVIPISSGVGYSPGGWIDDNSILYSSSVDGSNNIWEIDINTGQKTNLTNIFGSQQIKPRFFKLN